MALSVLVLHGVGDVPSPTIIGALGPNNLIFNVNPTYKGAIHDELKDWRVTMLIGTCVLCLCLALWLLALTFSRKSSPL